MNTFRGIEEGLTRLLQLLEDENVHATFFTTGDVVGRFPASVEKIVSSGHELGCHGVSHRDFTGMDRSTAEWEIQESSQALRKFAPVVSFRAPYLKFPDEYLGLLEAADFRIDSSQAKYKIPYYLHSRDTGLKRIPVSATSSVLRLPQWIRGPYLSALASPVVLFVHPWEFVDLRREKLRLDCRFKTGDEALNCLGSVIRKFKEKDAVFYRMRDLLN